MHLKVKTQGGEDTCECSINFAFFLTRLYVIARRYKQQPSIIIKKTLTLEFDCMSMTTPPVFFFINMDFILGKVV